MPSPQALRRAVTWVALLNLAYFFIEFGAARLIGSVSLAADSIDFLEDAFLNFLIVFALGQSLLVRKRTGQALAFVLLIPSLLALVTILEKLAQPVPPTSETLSLVGSGALIVNLTCAFMLARFRGHRGSLAKAAFFSARNDAAANVAIVVAGFITALAPSIWPDLVVGIGIFVMNADAARKVWSAARAESPEAYEDLQVQA
ncbi:MAG: cation transporter [Anaerolineae bacterium]|nr:cation transporter [Anaerolineae bacterium]MDW8172005.1 cation transporter [Anaerolineae bacterium]